MEGFWGALELRSAGQDGRKGKHTSCGIAFVALLAPSLSAAEVVWSDMLDVEAMSEGWPISKPCLGIEKKMCGLRRMGTLESGAVAVGGLGWGLYTAICVTVAKGEW